MQKVNIKKAMNVIKAATIKHSPEILTGIGIAGMATTTVMAVRATPKALILIEDEKRRINAEIREEAERNGDEVTQQVMKLDVMDTVLVTWKLYLPAAITGVMSIACLVGASSINIKRNTTLATAYALSETALKEYQSKVIETIGEKKEQTIRDEVAKEKVKKDPVENHEVIITAKGETLCYDAVSGRYFKSDIEKIRRCVNDLNREMCSDMYISLNEFYDEIGLPHILVGDDLGWNIDNGYIEPRFSSQLATDGTPCLVLDYYVAPRYDYRNLM